MPEAHAITAVQSMPDSLTVVWDDGQSTRFPALWLRDCRPADATAQWTAARGCHRPAR